jgi:transposase
VRLSDFKAQQLVFIDESGANERTGDRKNAWSPRGCPIIVRQNFRRIEKWSILPAYTIDGYISTALFQGSINKDRFEEFILDFVLPLCSPFPGWNLVLVMDNASIHQSDIISKACERAGVLIRYLPPYSLDFNPIEYSFHDLKAWIRRHWIHVDKYHNFGLFLQQGICQTGGP